MQCFSAFTDTIQSLSDFEGHRLQSLTKEGAKFDDEDDKVVKRRGKAYKELFKPLTKYLKAQLGDKVNKVIVSQRLDKSPSVIVTGQYGNTANMERIMRAQTFASGDSLRYMAAQKTLELNPRHPIVVKLNELAESAPDDQATKDLGALLYDSALLVSGFPQDDLEGYSERVIRTVAKGLGVDSLELAPELQVSDAERKKKTKKGKKAAAAAAVEDEPAATSEGDEGDDREEEESGHDEF